MWKLFYKGTVSVDFWSNRSKLCGNYAFPQNFQTTKTGEITVFNVVRAYESFLKYKIMYPRNIRKHKIVSPKKHLMWNNLMWNKMWNLMLNKLEILTRNWLIHCVKSVRIRSFSDRYFPAFRLNTERYEYLSVLNPNARKYGPEKLQIRTVFTQ